MRSTLLTWTLLTACAASFSVAQSAERVSPSALSARQDFGQLPLTFEANRGQSNSQVKFLSRGNGYTAFLTAGGLTLALHPKNGAPAPGTQNTSAVVESHLLPVVHMSLLGAAKNPRISGEDLQPGRINYFLGNDPAKWLTNVPNFAKIRYKDVYPGIDLIYYGNHRQLEYDFEIKPGADPHKIRFEISGTTQIALDTEGNLELQVGGEQLRLQCPAVYQGSSNSRTPVNGHYVVTDRTHVAFEVAAYDSSKPLTIDPVLIYATYLGGSGTDLATGIAVDASGSVYLAGYSNSVDFPVTATGSLSPNSNHVFVAKLDPAGANLVYADYIGGNGADYGLALVLDGANDVYVTGSTTSSNFPAVKAYQPQQPGPYAGFLTRVSADGSSLLYSSYLGGNSFDQPAGIAIDNLGQVFVAGSTMSQNFPLTNAYQPSALPNQGGVYGFYGFLTKFSADGSSLVYSTYLAGNSVVAQDCGIPCWPAPYNQISAVSVDANGAAYVTGTTNADNFPTTPGAFLTSNSTQQGPTVGFLSKFTSAGALAYSTYFYGSSENPIQVNAIAVDDSGASYITGYAVSDGSFPITSTGICDPGAYGFGCSYAFVTKFDPTGSTLLYSTFLGQNNYANPRSIQVDAAGNAYVLASTTSAAFQTNTAIEAYSNRADLLLVEIDPGGTTELFSTFLGGDGNESPAGMALDAQGNIYISGFTDSSDFPVTQAAFQGSLGGASDAFVAKIGAGSSPTVSLAPNSLQYAGQTVGSASQAQQVKLRNVSSLPLAIASISTSGDYSETDDCGSGIAAAGTCTVSITFTPTAAGTRVGSLRVNDNASGSPRIVSLSGTGLGSAVSLAPASLSFASTLVGSKSTAQTVQLTNTGTVVLSISNIQIVGDFGQANNCPANLAIGTSCSFSITFSPTASGNRSGSLLISDNAPGGSQSVGLTGSGLDFTVVSSPTSATIKAGSSASYTLNVSSVGGVFSNPVTLSCSGAPASGACSLSSATVTPGANGTSVTLTVSTTAKSAATVDQNRPVFAFWMQLPGFGIFGFLVVGSKLKGKRFVQAAGVLLVGVLLLMTACAGGTGVVSQTKPVTYTINVTATSGTLQHTLPVTLTVQ